MKILMINSVCGIKSTGRICTDLADELTKRGHAVMLAYGRGQVPPAYKNMTYKIGSKSDAYIHGCYARLCDASGWGSKTATERLISWIKDFNPDVIHLHNLHGYYLNIEILFDYLKKANKRVIWTLHDCWPFTGHCCYFDYVQCEKWKTGCRSCPQKGEYPASLLLDRSEINYARKKAIFSNANHLTIVTPSRWLASLVKDSFLSAYPVHVIPNWVNLYRFLYTPGDFRVRYQINRKYMILGVASVWDRRKGLDVFLKLHHTLGDEYQIVLVGLNEKQKKELPEDIIGISHTSSTAELAEIYSAADLFLNPTYEDNYPSTNLEAIACGTPVISFDSGGSGESANLFGITVQKNDIEALKQAIKNITDGTKRLIQPDLERMNQMSFERYCELLEGGDKT